MASQRRWLGLVIALTAILGAVAAAQTPERWLRVSRDLPEDRWTVADVFRIGAQSTDPATRQAIGLLTRIANGDKAPAGTLIMMGSKAVIAIGDTLLAAARADTPLFAAEEKARYGIDEEWRLSKARRLNNLDLIRGCVLMLGEIKDQRALGLLKRLHFDTSNSGGPLDRMTYAELQRDVNDAIAAIAR